MTYNLIIDDELIHDNSFRDPNKVPKLCGITSAYLINKYYNEEWVKVASYQEAIAVLNEKGCPQFISFDNDLGGNLGTDGIDVAKWLVNKDLDEDGNFIIPEFGFFVHSQNPIAREQINSYLTNYLNTKC